MELCENRDEAMSIYAIGLRKAKKISFEHFRKFSKRIVRIPGEVETTFPNENDVITMNLLGGVYAVHSIYERFFVETEEEETEKFEVIMTHTVLRRPRLN